MDRVPAGTSASDALRLITPPAQEEVGVTHTSLPPGASELHHFQAVLDATPDCTFVADAETFRLLYVNEAACRMTGFTREELLQIPPNQLTGQQRDECEEMFAQIVTNGDAGLTRGPHLAASKDGERKGWWEPHFRAVLMDGRWRIVCVSREVTSRVLADRTALRAQRLYATLSATNEAIMRARTPGELFQKVCDVAVTVGGFPSASILMVEQKSVGLRVAGTAGRSADRMSGMLISVDQTHADGNNLAALAYWDEAPRVSQAFASDGRMQPWHHPDAETELKAAAALPIMRERRPVGVLMLFARERRGFDDETMSLLTRMTENLAFALHNIDRDAERERAQERIRYLATHDVLTGLPNRLLFGELLSSAVHHAKRYGERLAVMFIDLDRFKLVNDTLGHSAGDLLLKQMACRLRTVLRASDVVARLGGDEFVVLATDISGDDDVHAVASKLLGAIAAPVSVMGQPCSVSASIGISLYPAHGSDDKTLLRNADAAMYRAKEQGKNRVAVFALDC
jgi:diguanylate cyclase (GGDEF)-like protein/PAS domain S-box-containing protein